MMRRLAPVLSLGKNSLNPLFVLRKHWHYGRWLLLSSALSWFSSDVYYAILSSVSGLAAAGQLRILMNFALPLLQTCNALSLFALPYVCRTYTQNGIAGLASVTRRLTCAYGAVSILYWGAILTLKAELLHSLYNAQYNALSSSVVFVAASSLPLSILFVPALILRTLRRPRGLLVVNVASTAVAMLIGFPAAKRYGLTGALVAMAASNVTAMVVAFVLVAQQVSVVSFDLE